MGESFYSILVELFSNDHNRYLSSDEIVSCGLASIGTFCACAALSALLFWLTTKSVLARGSLMVKLFIAYFALLAFEFLGQVVAYPDAAKLALDYFCTTIGLFIAFLAFQRRHIIVGLIYEYKYTLGLIKTLGAFDKVEK